MPEAGLNPFETIITLESFRRQLDFLSRHYPIIPLSEAVGRSGERENKKPVQVVLTFDDGYQDNYEIVFPLLKEKGFSASFFLPTDYIGSGQPLWDWQVFDILNDNRSIRKLEIGKEVFKKRALESRRSFIFRIIDKLKSAAPSPRQEMIKSLSGYNGLDRCLNWEEVRKMAAGGMEIGSHARSHSSLARIPIEDAEEEIRESKVIIEQNIKGPCRHFAFPFGSRDDYNEDLIDAVTRSGYESCLLNIHGCNYHNRGSFHLRRVIINEGTNLNYVLG